MLPRISTLKSDFNLHSVTWANALLNAAYGLKFNDEVIRTAVGRYGRPVAYHEPNTWALAADCAQVGL